MNESLIKIKQAILTQRYRFTEKAITEMVVDGITVEEVLESIMNAQFVRRKKSTHLTYPIDWIYIIESFTFSGCLIYTKGTFREQADCNEEFCILISSKLSQRNES